MDKNNLLEKIGQLKNPLTKKTFVEESRLIEHSFTDTECLIVYRRDGMSPQDKRVVEEQMYSLLVPNYDEDNITIKTVSQGSQDVLGKEPAPKKTAQLQTGHGPAGATKKRVPNVKKVIAISSGKGGVGKSTVTVNLAITLARGGAKVGVLDADIYGPSVPMLLGKRNEKPAATEDKKIIPIDAHGIKFMSFGLFISESDPVIWRGPMLGGVLNQFLFDVEWGELDYLIIDLPPGTGDMQLSLIQATDIDGTLVVSTPQDVALLDSKKGLNMFKQVKTPVLGMVQNMSYFSPPDSKEKFYIFGKGGVETSCRELGVPFLGEIPLEIELREGSDSGVPYMTNNSYEGRPVWSAYEELADNLKKQIKGDSKKTGFLGKLFNK